jgi:hypothetical protein
MIHILKALTLRGVPPELERIILKQAAESGDSLNRVAIALMEQGAGLKRKPRPELHHDLDRLSGSWSAEEADAFDRDLAQQRRIDLELWK